MTRTSNRKKSAFMFEALTWCITQMAYILIHDPLFFHSDSASAGLKYIFLYEKVLTAQTPSNLGSISTTELFQFPDDTEKCSFRWKIGGLKMHFLGRPTNVFLWMSVTPVQQQPLFFWSHSPFTTALTPGLKVPHSLPPQVHLRNPRMTAGQITSPDPSTSVRHQSGSLMQECPPKAKKVRIDCSIAQSSYRCSHPQHKKQFGVGMPPWILIIERFLGHTRFISRQQGPSSDFQRTAIQKYHLPFSSKTSTRGITKILSSGPPMLNSFSPHTCEMW